MPSPTKSHPEADPIGSLYEETGFLVFRRCLRMLNDRQEAHDVTQWTFVRAMEVGFQVRSRGEALVWLYGTATRRCLALLRDEGNRRRIRDAHGAEIGAAPSPSPEAQTVGHDLLRRALREVDARAAEIALLTHVQGLSVERAAEICGVSERTVARERRVFEAALARLVGEGESHG